VNPYGIIRLYGEALDSLKGTELDWEDAALCAQVDHEIFFPEKGGSSREAKQVCRGCVVREPCLEYALRRDEQHGIWAGFSPEDREAAVPQYARGVSARDLIGAADAEYYAREESAAERRRKREREASAANRAAIAALTGQSPQSEGQAA
jgi:WhiB family transcriptional regulator, redox-sensing transcriptional regulator